MTNNFLPLFDNELKSENSASILALTMGGIAKKNAQ